MKFPSLKNLADGFIDTVKRFPFELLFALAGTIAAIINTEWHNITFTQENWYVRVILIANLGLLLNLAVSLYVESKNITTAIKTISKIIATLFAVSLTFLLNPEERSYDYFRFVLFSLAFHLLVSFSAFTGKENIQGFWQFNKTIFLRFLTGVLYSMVLYCGLAAAIGASSFLFNLKIEWHTYTILWYCIAGIFNTLFFLAGVPKDTHALNEDFSYPKGLKIFTQYVLIPLATVYVSILLAYEAKLLAQWRLPKGMVSNLILGYAVYGILSILLIYPIREQGDNKWIKIYARSFYFLLIPLLTLLFLAVGARVFSYGITEYRYFLLILACWLLFITVYFLLSKKQNIKIIPISLCVLTLLSIYGPQSAFSVSTNSQRGILINIFKKYKAFKSGKMIAITEKISNKDSKNAIDKLTYLIRGKDLNVLQPYINVNLDSITNICYRGVGSDNVYGNKYELKNHELKWVRNYLGLSSLWGTDEFNDTYANTYQFKSDHNKLLSVANYDFVLQGIDQSPYVDKSVMNNITFTQKGERETDTYTLSIANEEASFDVKAFADSLTVPKNKVDKYKKEGNDYILPENMLSITRQTKHYIVTYKINSLAFDKPENKDLTIRVLEGCYLIKNK